MQRQDEAGQRFGPIEEYNSKRLEEMLGEPKTESVAVFRLKEGMHITIGGGVYRVVRVRQNGKITIKYKGIPVGGPPKEGPPA